MWDSVCGFGGAIQNESGTLNLLNTIIADDDIGIDQLRILNK
jgi:hypothetical protein